MTARFRLGFDIGGTFTDFVLVDPATGATWLNKCLTTPEDPSRAVIEGLESLLAKAGAAGGDVEIMIHATTLITNALIERKGAVTSLVATEGFRDVLEMGTEVRYDVYDLFLEKPPLLVPRRRRHDVRERLDRAGNVLTPLDESSLSSAADIMRADGTEAVAVVFLHAFRNPEHERRAAQFLAAALPSVAISLGSAVAPEIREYERMSTTVANAYVQPITRAYLDRIEDQLATTGYRRRLYLMISSGGIAAARTAKEFPIRIVESGPTAGVLAAAYYGRQIGIGSLVTFDMGGTTAKIGLVKNHQPGKSSSFEVGRVARFKKGSGIPIKLPMVELIEIGAGGGSIAHVDQLGLLKVGPISSGAVPGPACYGRGGDSPTVTDTNLLLGYLDADYFLGGAMRLDRAAAERAVARGLGAPLGLSTEACARGVFEVVTQNMLAAMKVHIAERDEDPRKFYLFAFGGAGPAHAYDLARALHMRGIIVPPGAGATSAVGLVTAAVSFDYARSFVTRLDRVEWPALAEVFDAMAQEGLGVLAEAGVPPEAPGVTVRHAMDLRHKGQGHEVTVTLPDQVFATKSTQAVAELFYAAHREKYGHAHTNLPVELITCRTTVAAPAPGVPLPALADRGTEPALALKGHRRAWFSETGGMVDTPVYDRYRLGPGMVLGGPAIIEERESTAICGPSGTVRLDRHGALFIDLPQPGAA